MEAGSSDHVFYGERLLTAAIGQKVIAGRREVLFQAATNKLQTF
jgi:hypothetical protein